MFDLFYGLFKAIFEDIKNCVNSVKNKRLDRSIFNGTKFDGKKFTMESGWDNFETEYASPVFVFNRGERVVIDRCGNINIL